MYNTDKILYCKDCHNAVYETINNMPYLYCKVLKKHVGFYIRPCDKFN